MKKIISLILVTIMLITCLPNLVFAEDNITITATITATITDGITLKGSKKTFDVFARNSAGEKVSSSVTLNGESVPVNWDDDQKTSFTLTLTQEGENTVVITAENTVKEITVYYEKAQAGEPIGRVVFAIELFSLGCGYLIEPTYVDIYEGENAAASLVRFLEENGYTSDYTGSVESSFYLSGIGSSEPFPLTPNVPDCVMSVLEQSGGYFDEYGRYDDYWLGEFDYNYSSGWMYAVNDVFPNVGFADYYLGDGDVLRTQFTLAYGADIGDSWGEPLYEVQNRDALTALIAEVLNSERAQEDEISNALAIAMETVAILDADAETLNNAYNQLNTAYFGAACEHTETEWSTLTEPTFEAEGLQTEICKECGETLTQKSIAKLVYGDSDRDGVATISDLAFLRGCLLNSVTFNEIETLISDLNGNGKIDAVDIVMLKKSLAE